MHDCVEAEALLDAAAGKAAEIGAEIDTVTADKGYDSAAIVRHIEQTLGATAVIPQLSNRKEVRPVDWAHYKKLAERFSSFIELAAAFVWLA